MAIPTIPGSARVQDVQIGAPRNAAPQLRALGQVRKTFSQADSALEGGIGMIQEYEERKRKAEEAAFFSKSSVVTLNATTDALKNLKKQPDDQIVPNWTTTANTTKEAITNDPDFAKMSPRAQATLKLHLNSWQGKSTATFQEKADMLASQRRAATAIAAKKAFAKTGDDSYKKNAMAALEAQRKAGDLTDDAYKYQVATMDEDFERSQVQNGIDADPYSTLKKINAGGYKSVSERDLATLKNQAERQVDYIQRTTSGDLANEFASTGVAKTDRELQEMKKAGKITGSAVVNYQKMVAREDHRDAQDNQALMLTQLRDMDLANSDNPERDVRKITDEAMSLPPQLQEEIHTLSDSKLKEAKKGQARDIHIGQLDLMREAHQQSLGRILISSRTDTEPARRAESVESIEEMDEDKFAAEFGDDAVKKDVLRRAKEYVKSENLRYARGQKQYVDWSKTTKGAQATPEQAAAERERLGFGRYTTTDDVTASYKAGKIDRVTAKGILARQFGIP